MEVSINGAKIYTTIPILGGIPITESLVNSWIVMAIITLVCIWLTRGLKVENISKKQAVAEFLVTTCENYVTGNMGKRYASFVPFVGALFTMSILGSFSSLLGVYPFTSDLSVVLGWAVMVFVMITYTKMKSGGIGGYLKGFTEPFPVFTPFNIISELATPISMGFRHFGNVLSGTVINALVYGALALASHALLGWLPGALGNILGNIPLLQVGVPAILSLYFDIFSGFMQAFIFTILTMLYISNANDTPETEQAAA